MVHRSDPGSRAGAPWPSDPIELTRALYPPLMAAARHLAGQEAEDLVQESLLQVLVRHPDFRDLAFPLGYTKTTLFRLAHRRFRQGPIEIPFETARLMDIPESGSTEEQVTQRLEVRGSLQKLDRRRRACVYLRYIEGYDTSVIAEILGCRPSTVRSQISRSLKLMRTGGQQ